MASSLNLQSLLSLSLSSKPSSLSPQTLRFSPSSPPFKKVIFSINSTSIQAPPTTGEIVPAITLTETALKQLNMMRLEKKEHFCVRIGAKQGGCSGNLSYTIEFEGGESSRLDDCVIEYDGFILVCDPKSFVVLRGAQLDYDDGAPFGGGFSFKNSNKTRCCGCCKFLCSRDVN